VSILYTGLIIFKSRTVIAGVVDRVGNARSRLWL
jgi:hypothetical protein